MAGYDEGVIDRVREANDIVSVVSSYLPLKFKGGSYWGICPFHSEKSPSFHVEETRQIFKCFGCGAGGNVFTFVQRMENLDFVDALKFLAERAHVPLPERGRYDPQAKAAADKLKADMYEINALAARFFYDQLQSPRGAQARAYLEKRQVSPQMRVKYGLGYSPDDWTALADYMRGKGCEDKALVTAGLVSDKNGKLYDRFRGRLMFPIFDATGKVVGFGGRVIGEGEPKYLNSPETPVFEKAKNMYSINFARKERSDQVIVAEGYMDVISLYQYGFRTAIAALGTAFGTGHVAAIKKIAKRVTLLFDSDEAGQKAAFRALDVLKGSGLDIKVLRLEGAKDPDEFLKAYGAEAFESALVKAPDGVMFRLNAAKKNADVTTTEGKLKFSKEAAAIIATTDDAIERDVYAREASEMGGVDMRAITREADKTANKTAVSAQGKAKRFTGANAASTAQSGKAARKGDDEARRHILSLMTKPGYFDQIAAELTGEEMLVPVYITLFDIIKKKVAAGSQTNAAGLISNFEEPAEQQAATNVFADYYYEDEQKAFSDHIRQIKRAYYEERIKSSKDVEEMQNWQNKLKGVL